MPDPQNTNTITVFPSAARTAAPTPFTFVNKFHKGVHVFIDVTAVTDTPSITVFIQGFNAVSNDWYTLLQSAAITAIGNTLLRVEPAVTDEANLVEGAQLPRQFRIALTHADADSITYSIGANLLI